MGGSYRLTKHVYFIGFTGAGKTSVAQYLAKAEGLKWADVDDNIELWEKRSLAKIAEDREGLLRDAADYSIDTIERDVAETAAGVRDVLLEAGVLTAASAVR